MKNLWLALALLIGGGSTLFGNGGAWQAGVPATGNASASKNDRHTDVTIENEMLKIDLHPEYADVTVRYRMHNTGPKVQQDFFFPVERWEANPDADWIDVKRDDIDHYQISVDGKQLKWTKVAGPKEKSSETKKETNEDEPGKQQGEARKQRNDGRNQRNDRKAAKQNSQPAKRTKKAQRGRSKQRSRGRRPRKTLGAELCKKASPRSSHGRNRLFLLNETKRGS